MTREIKFRAWDTDKNEYVDCSQHTISQLSNQYAGLGNRYIYQQFTGLKDKNGKEIFEGDIVAHNNGVAKIEYRFGDFKLVGVEADKYERVYSTLYHYLIDSTLASCANNRFDGVTTNLGIIGNIHDNPELLEVE